MKLERAWVIVDDKTGKIYDEEIYGSEWRAELAVKEGSYYLALHTPVVLNLRAAMERWMDDLRKHHSLAVFPYNAETFEWLEVAEALVICKFLGLWQMDGAEGE